MMTPMFGQVTPSWNFRPVGSAPCKACKACRASRQCQLLSNRHLERQSCPVLDPVAITRVIANHAPFCILPGVAEMGRCACFATFATEARRNAGKRSCGLHSTNLNQLDCQAPLDLQTGISDGIWGISSVDSAEQQSCCTL